MLNGARSIACGVAALATLASLLLFYSRTAVTENRIAQQIALPSLGMHFHHADTSEFAWPSVRIGSWRLHDAGVAWPQLEPADGQWRFEKLDRLVEIAMKHRVELLLPLVLTPVWASARPGERSSYGPGNAAEPRNLDTWRRYVRTVVERYRGRIRQFEIWNEPNDKGFFSGDVKTLVTLTCAAYDIVKQVSNDNMVVSPSPYGRTPDYLEAFLDEGGGRCIDVVGYHFYVPEGEPEEMVPVISRVKLAMARHGIGKMPLWNTEAGWWFGNDDGTPDGPSAPTKWRRYSASASGGIVGRALLLAFASGVERFYWYAWDNRRLGMIEPTMRTSKPAAVAFGQVGEWLLAGRLVSCNAVGTTWVCDMDSTFERSRLIAWTQGGGRSEWPIPAEWRVISVASLNGRTITRTPTDESPLALGPEPVLVSMQRRR